MPTMSTPTKVVTLRVTDIDVGQSLIRHRHRPPTLEQQEVMRKAAVTKCFVRDSLFRFKMYVNM